MNQDALLHRFRIWMALFIAGLLVSGLTAFPLESELGLVLKLFRSAGLTGSSSFGWLQLVHSALLATGRQYPFLAYGTDWLAFAHIVIAIAFIGPLRDPVRNEWLITFGLIACAGVVPLALIAGAIRDIPFGWRLIDMSFGVLGCVPLLICRQCVKGLQSLE